MKRALIVATVGGFIDFEKDNILRLEKLGYEVDIACVKTGWEKYLTDIKGTIIDTPFSRNPLSIRNVRAYRKLQNIIKKKEYQLIHCHTPTAGVLARIAAREQRRKGCRVIYTAHGFHFYKGAPLRNWLLYYPVEWLCSWFTDVLITINSEDFEFAKKRMHAKRIEYVPGIGINIDTIKNIKVDKSQIRYELGLEEKHKFLLSVGELNRNKNHQIILEAIAKIGKKNIHYFIAGEGDLYEDLIKLSKKFGIAEQIHFLGHRDDIIKLDKTADLFCFPSHREGLSVALLEAIACGIPIVCSDIRGNRDLAQENDNIIKFNEFDVNDCIEAIKKGLTFVRKESSVITRFSTLEVDKKMKEIYKEIGNEAFNNRYSII